MALSVLWQVDLECHSSALTWDEVGQRVTGREGLDGWWLQEHTVMASP